MSDEQFLNISFQPDPTYLLGRYTLEIWPNLFLNSLSLPWQHVATSASILKKEGNSVKISSFMMKTWNPSIADKVTFRFIEKIVEF